MNDPSIKSSLGGVEKEPAIFPSSLQKISANIERLALNVFNAVKGIFNQTNKLDSRFIRQAPHPSPTSIGENARNYLLIFTNKITGLMQDFKKKPENITYLSRHQIRPIGEESKKEPPKLKPSEKQTLIKDLQGIVRLTTQLDKNEKIGISSEKDLEIREWEAKSEKMRGSSKESKESLKALLNKIEDGLDQSITEISLISGTEHGGNEKFAPSEVLSKLKESEWGKAVFRHYPELEKRCNELEETAKNIETSKIVEQLLRVPLHDSGTIIARMTRQDFDKIRKAGEKSSADPKDPSALLIEAAKNKEAAQIIMKAINRLYPTQTGQDLMRKMVPTQGGHLDEIESGGMISHHNFLLTYRKFMTTEQMLKEVSDLLKSDDVAPQQKANLLDFCLTWAKSDLYKKEVETEMRNPSSPIHTILKGQSTKINQLESIKKEITTTKSVSSQKQGAIYRPPLIL